MGGVLELMTPDLTNGPQNSYWISHWDSGPEKSDWKPDLKDIRKK
jgi:hypothetical protein